MINRYAVIGILIAHTRLPLIHRALATRPGAQARLTRAANFLKFDGKRILAEDLCGCGLVTDMERNVGLALRGQRVLLLGAGRAARGVLLALLDRQPAKLVVANRSITKARLLDRQLAARGRVASRGDADLAGERFDVVVDATGASLRGELPPVSPQVFADDALAYELVYGHGLTPFLRLAQNAGVRRLADGVGMLVEQAAETFAWWHGIRPDTRPVINAFTVPLV